MEKMNYKQSENLAAVKKERDNADKWKVSRDEEKRQQTRMVIQCRDVTVGEAMEECEAAFSKISNHVNSGDGISEG